MGNNTYKQFVYDLATLWSQYEIEIYSSLIDGPMGNPSPAIYEYMSLFQWARFYWESDEKYAIRPHQQSWFRMSCRKGGRKYQLFTHKARMMPLRVSELLKEYDRQEILFRRFQPATNWRPAEQTLWKRNWRPTGEKNKVAESWKGRQERIENNPILYRQFGESPKYHPLVNDESRVPGLIYPDEGRNLNV